MKTGFNRKQRGSVLLTVLFVMTILIVFLMGTLALSVATNDRAHVNYSTAQTGITARDVAESVYQSLVDVNRPADAYATADRQALTKAVARLKSTDEPIHLDVDLNGGGTNTMGHVDDVEISFAGTRDYFDTTSNSWQSSDLIRIKATVTLSGVTSSSSLYVVKHYDGQTEDGSTKKGAGFVTTATAAFSCSTNLYGGGYISLPTYPEALAYTYSNDHVADMLNGTKGDTVITNSEGIGLKGRGFETDYTKSFKLYNSSGVLEADLFINDNLYIENWSGIIFPSEGTGITIMGDLPLTNAVDHINYSYKGKKGNLAFNKVPYIYVDGKIISKMDRMRLGSDPTKVPENEIVPLNTFCGAISVGKFTSEGGPNYLTTNLYCMDTDQTSTIFNASPTTLKLWTDSVVTNAKDVSDKGVVKGEVCSNGDLLLFNTCIKGDVRVRGNLYIVDHNNKKSYVNGNVVVGGEIKLVKVDGSGNITGDSSDQGEEEVRKRLVKEDGSDANIYNNAFTPPPGTSIGAGHEVENKIGKFFVYTVNVDSSDGKYKDPWGDLLSDDIMFLNGEAKDPTEDVDGIKIYYCTSDPADATEDKAYRDHFYYEEGIAFAEGTDDQYYAYTTVKEFTAPSTFVTDSDYSKMVPDKTFNWGDVTQAFLDAKGEKSIYPEYAERYAILGINEYQIKYNQVADGDHLKYSAAEWAKIEDDYFNNGIEPPLDFEWTVEGGHIKEMTSSDVSKIVDGSADKISFTAQGQRKSDLKITKTLEEVMRTVANPYAEGELPEKVKQEYQKIKDGTISCTNYNSSSDLNNSITVSNHAKFESCTINGDVTIEAGSGVRIIIISGEVNVQSGKNIIVDDTGVTNSGEVYFILEDGAKLNMKGNYLITQAYKTAFEGCDKWYYNSTNPGAGYKNLSTEVQGTAYMPKVYMYGKAGTEFNCENARVYSINIQSSDIKVSIKGTEIPSWAPKSLYYDEVDVMNPKPNLKDTGDGMSPTGQFILGRCNAKDVDIPNQINVLYITDGVPKKSGSGGGLPDAYWWYPIYSSEF